MSLYSLYTNLQHWGELRFSVISRDEGPHKYVHYFWRTALFQILITLVFQYWTAGIADSNPGWSTVIWLLLRCVLLCCPCKKSLPHPRRHTKYLKFLILEQLWIGTSLKVGFIKTSKITRIYYRDGRPLTSVSRLAPNEISSGTSDYRFCPYYHLEPFDDSAVHQTTTPFCKINFCYYIMHLSWKPEVWSSEKLPTKKHSIISSCRLPWTVKYVVRFKKPPHVLN
jgi:hypothetical protein